MRPKGPAPGLIVIRVYVVLSALPNARIRLRLVGIVVGVVELELFGLVVVALETAARRRAAAAAHHQFHGHRVVVVVVHDGLGVVARRHGRVVPP